LGVTVGADDTTAEMDVLSESGAAAVKLLAAVVEHPLLPESELARLKTKCCGILPWPRRVLGRLLWPGFGN